MERKVFGFQCPRCFIKSGRVSIDSRNAPSCCGGERMEAYEIIINPNKKR